MKYNYDKDIKDWETRYGKRTKYINQKDNKSVFLVSDKEVKKK